MVAALVSDLWRPVAPMSGNDAEDAVDCVAWSRDTPFHRREPFAQEETSHNSDDDQFQRNGGRIRR
jgi:hypothetical protein